MICQGRLGTKIGDVENKTNGTAWCVRYLLSVTLLLPDPRSVLARLDCLLPAPRQTGHICTINEHMLAVEEQAEEEAEEEAGEEAEEEGNEAADDQRGNGSGTR